MKNTKTPPTKNFRTTSRNTRKVGGQPTVATALKRGRIRPVSKEDRWIFNPDMDTVLRLITNM